MFYPLGDISHCSYNARLANCITDIMAIGMFLKQISESKLSKIGEVWVKLNRSYQTTLLLWYVYKSINNRKYDNLLKQTHTQPHPGLLNSTSGVLN